MTRNRWLDTVSYSGILLLIWWLLTDGAASSWWIGIPAVLLALLISYALDLPTISVWSRLPGFLLFFFQHSFYDYTMRLPSGLPQVMMASSVGLLPGTLSVEIENNVLTVHVLDGHTNFVAELEAVESNIARLFGKSLDDSKEVIIR